MSEVSEKQLEANRKNAKLGGVKTEEGKKASKLNALKHGLLSREVLIDGENEQDLVELGKRLRVELKPIGELESALADRVVANLWRLKRTMRIEREMLESDADDTDVWGGKHTLGAALSRSFVNYDTYGKFIRYESSIERGMYKALHELQRLQQLRNGLGAHLPPVSDDEPEEY